MRKPEKGEFRACLAEIIEEPSRISTLDPGVIPALLAELLAVQSALTARLLTSTRSQQEEAQDEVLTVQEAGKLLRLKPAYLYELVRQQRLPAIRIGKYVRISTTDLRAWLQQQKSVMPGPGIESVYVNRVRGPRKKAR